MKKRENFYRRDPGLALQGMSSMSLEERGVYNTVIDLLYLTWRPLEDDRGYIAGHCRCAVQKLNPILNRLIASGKLIAFIEDGRGYISNPKFEEERSDVKGAASNRSGRAKVEEKSAGVEEKSAGVSENPPLLDDDVEEKQPLKRLDRQDKSIYTPIVPSGDGSDQVDEQPDEVRKAFDLWNVLADECGLPVARDLTEARRRALRKRLAGQGITGWTEALSLVARSQFCRGLIKPKSPDDQPFRADLDFVLQPKSFQRLLEGFYNRGPDAPLPIADGAEAQPLSDEDRWRRHLEVFRRNFHWPDELGPRPGQEGCRAPLDLLGEFGFVRGVVPLNPLFPPKPEAKEPAHACR